jgi:hypothetical protein
MELENIGQAGLALRDKRIRSLNGVTLESLTEKLELADQLLVGRNTMFEPQDLPGRYGRAIKAVDRLLQIMNCPSVLAGGWAVWRHGFTGRITQDIDIGLPADRIEEFLRVASVSGFELLPQREGRWPKVRHKETDVKVDVLPEGARPGTPECLAPTTIPHPLQMGAVQGLLRYITLPRLIELKLAAGRMRDEYDVVELMRANLDKIDIIREHLTCVHADYVLHFDRLLNRARNQRDE